MDRQQLINMSFDEFVKFVDKEVTTPSQYNKNSMSLNFPYDLRESLEIKKQNCSAWHKWTVFLNNAGNLCHVISADADLLIRLKFSYPIKHLTPIKQLEMIKARIRNWVVL